MTTFSLATRCPRLALARDQHLAFEANRKAQHTRLHLHWTKLNSLVGHRELQLNRAYAKGNGRYIDYRQRKLDRALRELAEVEAALLEVAA